MDEDEDFLAAVEADNTTAPAKEVKEPEPAKEPAPEPPPVPEPSAPAEPTLAEPPTPTEPPVPPVAPQPEPAHVPIAAMLDERDKRKAAEGRLKQIEQERQAQPPQPTPDMFENPEEYTAFLQSQVEAARYQDRLFMSERLAKVEHGAEVFTKAKEWGLAKCDADPFFNAKVRSSQDPYGVVMEEFKREQTASIPQDEFQQFQAWKAAQAELTKPNGGQPPPTNPPPSIPPRSLASAPSAGNMLTEPAQSDEEIFEETFSKKE